MANKIYSSFFSNTKDFDDITDSNIFEHVTDFGNLKQFNLFESGYSLLYILSIPKFLDMLTRTTKIKPFYDQTKEYVIDTNYKSLIRNYCHILEHEFKGLDGLDDVSAETLEITDNIKSVNLINKINTQGATSVTFNGYSERSGSLITKFNELFLYGIKDPNSQIKTYHGLLDDVTISESKSLTASYENEVFTFLYIVTDNTMRNVEKAFILFNAQPTKADLSIYNSERGTYEKKELSLEFNCIPITGPYVNAKAQDVLNNLRIVRTFKDYIPSNLGLEGVKSPNESGYTSPTLSRLKLV